MPFNGSGSFVPISAPNYPAVPGQPIYASQFNANMTDLFGGLSNCVTRDGQSPATANLPMNGFKLTGLGDGDANGRALVYGQATTAVLGGALNVGGALSVTGAGTINGALAVGSAVAPGVYGFRVISTTGDRLRVVSLAAGSGVGLDVTDAGETTTARALSLGASNGTVYLGSSTQFSKDGSGNVVMGSGTSISSLNLQLTVNRSVQSGIAVGHGDGTFNNRVAMFADSSTQLVGWDTNYSSTFNGYVWRTVGAEVMRLNSNGLGLGTSGGPVGSALHVKSGLVNVAKLETTTARGSGQVALALFDPTGSKGYFGYGSANDQLQVYNALAGVDIYALGVQNARIDSGGVNAYTAANANGLSAIFRAGPTGSNGGALNFYNWNNSSTDINLARIYCQTTSGAVGNEAADLFFYTKPAGGGLSLRFRLADVGQIFAPAIHNNASGASGTTPMIASGTYTPTGTTVTNCSTLTMSPSVWMRVGNIVTVAFKAAFTFNAASTLTSFRFSLPVASNLTATTDLSGGGGNLQVSAANFVGGVQITGDTINDQAFVNLTAQAGTAGTVGEVEGVIVYEVK